VSTKKKKQSRNVERLMVDMMYRQDIESDVIDYIRNSGERVLSLLF
jgi:hypothetical protein